MGPYARADYNFENARDHDLWVKCLVESRQDYDLAKSYYIETLAEYYFAEERELREKEKSDRGEEIRKRIAAKISKRDEEEYEKKRIAQLVSEEEIWLGWLSKGTGYVVGGVSGLVLFVAGAGLNEAPNWLKWVGLVYIVLSAYLGAMVFHLARVQLVPGYRYAPRAETLFTGFSGGERIALAIIVFGSWVGLTGWWFVWT